MPFYYPHTVVALIPKVAKPKALYEGLCIDDFVKCRIPASWDTKRKWIGPKEKRVEIEGSLSLIITPTTERLFIVGTALILKHKPATIWVIEEVNHNDGVFMNAGTFDMLLSQHGASVPPTGDLRKYLDEF